MALKPDLAIKDAPVPGIHSAKPRKRQIVRSATRNARQVITAEDSAFGVGLGQQHLPGTGAMVSLD